MSFLALLAAPASLVTVALAYWCNRNLWGFLPDDLPGPGRKAHGRPIPLAGIALAPVLLTWLLVSNLIWLALAVAIAVAIGFLDDRQKEGDSDLDWRIKAVAIALAAAAAATQAVNPLAASGGGSIGEWLTAFAIVFVLTNATNFLDNTDGVAASLTGTSLLCATGGVGPLAGCGCAALGFLPFNWPRPLVFLGDSGALALGVCSGFACAQALPQWQAALPFAVQFADFTQVIIARLCIGVSPFVGDRRHLTHLVINLGLHRSLIAPLFAVVAAAIYLLLSDA